MKRILSFSAMIIAVLLLVSGCDGILEAMFPEETGQLGGNSIEVSIWISESTPGWDDAEVVVELREVNGLAVPYSIRRGWLLKPSSGGDPSVYFVYEGLPDGEYTLQAWLDVDGDTIADPGEPAGAVETEYGPIFQMPFPDFATFDSFSGMQFDIELRLPQAEPLVIRGPQIISVAALNQFYSYELVPVKLNRWVNSLEFGLRWGEDLRASGTSNDQFFDVNFVNASSESYAKHILSVDDVQLGSPDGDIGPYHAELGVRVVDEPVSAFYVLQVRGDNFQGPPFNLAWEQTYDVDVEIREVSGVAIGYLSFRDVLSLGGFQVTTEGRTDMNDIDSDGKFVYHPTTMGVDKVRIIIDVDGNGFFDDEADIAAEGQIGVDDEDPTASVGVYRAFVAIPTHRYLKYNDFIDIYGL